MKAFFKPPRRKVIYASILAFLPYVLAFILALFTDGWRDGLVWGVRWAPLLFVGHFFPQVYSTDIWLYNDDLFSSYVLYPLLIFLVWYLVSYAIAFFISNRTIR
jgi:hypothetical protein